MISGKQENPELNPDKFIAYCFSFSLLASCSLIFQILQNYVANHRCIYSFLP